MNNNRVTGKSLAECFIYILKPGSAQRYDELHAAVWPEVQAELRASGYDRYDIYRWGDLVITFTERTPGAGDALVPDHVRQRVENWADLLAPLFVASTDRAGELLRAHPVFSLTPERE